MAKFNHSKIMVVFALFVEGRFFLYIQPNKNNQERLSPKQFWVIRETNFTGKKMTAEWRYYANGDYVELDDEELATRLLLAENAKNIDWQL